MDTFDVCPLILLIIMSRHFSIAHAYAQCS